MALDNTEKIQLDEYRETKSKERLYEIADKLTQRANEIEGLRSHLSENWKGPAVAEYLSKFGKTGEEVRMESDAIRKIAEQLEHIIKRTKQAEEKAGDLGKQRSYKQ